MRMKDIISFLPDAMFAIDRSGVVIAWNRAIEVMTGVKADNMIGKGEHEYAVPFYGCRRPMIIDVALHPGTKVKELYSSIQWMGDVLYAESYAPNLPSGIAYLSATASFICNEKDEIIGAVECLRDNAEQKNMEDRLSRAEKMETLGALAGGVAHDLNNGLGVMVGYSELILQCLPGSHPQRMYIDKILRSSVRCSAIVQDLLTMTRRCVSVSEVINLNNVVLDYLGTPEHDKIKAYHGQIEIRAELDENIMHIKGSPVHLNKTVMNLVSNAVEAISGGGGVVIRTENCCLDRPLQGYETVRAGHYAVLSVSDTGTGISQEDREKIFEPFYTKKVMGRSGTGLGLCVVRGTVKDHHGYIDIQSQEHRGSTFSLYFPVTREDEAEEEQSIPFDAYRGKNESILVVDDIAEQRELAVNMLSRLGYKVETAASGEEAIALVQKRQVDLIVLDMIMAPGLDGLDTYSQILKITPGQKAVIVSGFSETDRVRKARKMGAGSFVQKPYLIEKIGAAIRRELDK